MFCFVFCLFLKEEVLKVTGLIIGHVYVKQRYVTQVSGDDR